MKVHYKKNLTDDDNTVHSKHCSIWQIPGAANEQDKMAALLESYERKLQSELVELYGRMVAMKRSTISSAGVGLI